MISTKLRELQECVCEGFEQVFPLKKIECLRGPNMVSNSLVVGVTPEANMNQNLPNRPSIPGIFGNLAKIVSTCSG